MWRAFGPFCAPLLRPPQRFCRRSLLTQSFSRGPSQPPLLDQTVGDHFRSIVSKYGDRTAVISRHQHERLSYDELDRKSNALARGLLERGVAKGDRVAVSLGNNIEYTIATYALFKIGAILVPLNPGFNAHQVISALSHLEASDLIIGIETNLPRKPPKSNIPLLESLIPNLHSRKLESEAVPALRQVITVDNSDGRIATSSITSTVPYNEIIASGSTKSLPEQPLHPSEIANIQFTSGTTSAPKAACLTHHSILNNGFFIGHRMLLTPADIICCPPPLFHCFGSILGYMASATHGAAIVFPSESFDAQATLHAVRDEKCTALYGVPTMFISELELLSQSNPKNPTVPTTGFSTLRTGIAAGSSIPATLMHRLHSTLNLTELTICYGQTETSPVSLMTTPHDPMEKRINSVGRLLPHVSAKVVTPGKPGEVVPVGVRGELCVAGYNVMRGYWGDAVRTAEVLKSDESGSGEVWMHTGDEAEMDAEGYVKITGRLKDIIIRGGENIHPLEVENCLLGHPGVREVSCVGVSDSRYGEVVGAFVVGRGGRGGLSGGLTGGEVREWVRGRLSGHLVPKYVFWVEGFPKTASGKIQKFKLKQDAVELIRNGHGLS